MGPRLIGQGGQVVPLRDHETGRGQNPGGVTGEQIPANLESCGDGVVAVGRVEDFHVELLGPQFHVSSWRKS